MKKFLLSMALVAAGFGFANAQTTVTFEGQPATFDGTWNSGNTAIQPLNSVTVDDVVMSFTDGGNSTKPAWYKNGADYRTYAKHSIKFEAPAGQKITSIVFTASKANYGNYSNMSVTAGTISPVFTADNKPTESFVLTWTDNTGVGDVTFTLPSSKDAWASGNPQFRFVKAVVTLQGGSGPVIPTAPTISGETTFYDDETEITMTAQAGAKIYYTVGLNDQVPADPTTSSTLYSEPLTISTTATFKAIAELNGQVSAVATATFTKKDLPTVANIAAFLALEDGTVAKFVNPVEVSFGGVWNKRYLFVKDETGSLQIYDSSNSLVGNYEEGQTISGFTVERATYLSTPQGNAAGYSNTFPATAEGRTYDVKPLRINPTKADVEANLDAFVYLYNGSITKTGNNLFVGEIQLYNRFSISEFSSLADGQLKDIEGFAVMYNSTPEIYVSSIGEPGTLGVNENRIDNVLIYGAEGFIVAPQGAEIYGVNGVRYNTNVVAPGLYIVRYKGTTVKVVVK